MKVAVVALLAFGFASAAAIVYVMEWNGGPIAVAEPVTVSLNQGESFTAFARRLHDRGVLSHPQLWSRLAAIRGLARRVRAGEYRVAPEDTPETLLQRLIVGDVVTYHARLIEGWTAMQAVTELAGREELTHELRSVDVVTLLDALGLPGGHAEGLFFPDTYQFVRGDSDADILRHAYARMQAVLQSAWSARDLRMPHETPYQALIVASLIEKETARDADRAQISQVFVTRLREGMRLQTTAIFGAGTCAKTRRTTPTCAGACRRRPLRCRARSPSPQRCTRRQGTSVISFREAMAPVTFPGACPSMQWRFESIRFASCSDEPA
jgi:UPF0755 protein